ncbi:MAG: N-acetyltransferase [Acidobacteriaceae bacterium]
MKRPEASPDAGGALSSAPTIRRMTAGDLPAVVAIAAACPEAPRWLPADYSAYTDAAPQFSLLRAGFVAVTSSDSNSPIGFAAVSLLAIPSGQPDPDSRCELDSVAVHPHARRRGLGTALLEAVLAWARENTARRLVLELRAGNAGALGLYHRFGLRQEGRRPRYYADPEEDALLLGMAITSESATASFSTEKAVEGGPPRC